MWMELKKGEANPMLEAAQAISITGEKSPEERERDDMRGEVVAESWEKDPRNPRNQKQDRTDIVEMADGERMPRWLVEGDDAAGGNDKGSFESLMGGWGQSSHGRALDTRGASS
jgi:hypothetical protein